ncbi:MAG: prenyltransferase/squalene oxidase repeat-containing protein [Planctomycetaceae bacterium]
MRRGIRLVTAPERQETELIDKIKKEVRRDLPGALVSLGLHVVVLLVLALIAVAVKGGPDIGAIQLEWAKEQIASAPPAVQMVTPIRIEQPNLVPLTPPPMVEKPKEAVTQTQPVEVKPVDMKKSLSGRQKKDADKLTTRDAFNEDSRKAIDRSLAWIVRQQFPDGHWSLQGPYPDGASTRWSTDVGGTGLALLALLGDGHTPQLGNHSAAVAKGLKWLQGTQQSSGVFYQGVEEGREPTFYAHSIATMVMCEALTLTGDEQYRAAAEKGIEYLVRSQNPVEGGWGYRPLDETGEGDLSVSGWALMALHTARMADIEVPGGAFLLASRFLDRCQEAPANESRYKYRPNFSPATDIEQRAAMTASGLLARQWMGWPKNYPPLIVGVDFLLEENQQPRWEAYHRNAYGWYYAAEVLHNYGGDRWKEWFADLQQMVVSAQKTRGRDSGSWDPNTPVGSPHEWSDKSGRLYLTVLCTLILETPFRHEPLYE